MSYLLLPRKIPCQLSHSCLSLAFSSSPCLTSSQSKPGLSCPLTESTATLGACPTGVNCVPASLCPMVIIIITWQKLPYGRQGLTGGIVGPGYTSFKRVHFGVFSASCFAPLALSSDWTFSQLVPTDPLGVVMIFYVLWPHGGPTNLRG